MSGILNEFRCLDLRKILSELLFLTEQEDVELPVLLMCKYTWNVVDEKPVN